MFADQLPHTAQMILGLDRESPIFTVYADDEEQLHFYYGFERLEVVSADRHAPNFKMLVGRLYNSGIKRKVLCETFGVDLKTIRGWAEGRADSSEIGVRGSAALGSGSQKLGGACTARRRTI
jgi:hypothetical protein